MQAIVTKFLPATNTKGSRVKATAAAAGSVIIGWDHALDTDGNPKAAAIALCHKFGWDQPYRGKLVTGGLPNGDSVHVFSEE